MSSFEYIIPLISVLVGIAIADLATSFHRLLRARDRVQWDWLTLTSALFAIIIVLRLWWGFYGLQNITSYQTLGGFLPLAATLVILYLIKAAALPDNVPPEGIDLRVFYENNYSYFWFLFAIYVFLDIVQTGARRIFSDWELIKVLVSTIPNFVLLLLFISLVFIQKRLYHAVIVVVLLILSLTQWYDISLGAV